MEIKTKYNIGDSHWDLDGRTVKARRVREIRISVQDCGDAAPLTAITYVVDGSHLVPQDSFVETKQDLLNSL